MVKYWNYRVFRKIIKKMNMGYSPVVLITGNPNTGKTSLGALLSEVIHYYLHGKEWNPEKNCFFDMNELSKKLLNAKKQSILIAEAGYDLSFDEWASKVNKFFDKVVTTQRIMGNCYILNIPVAKDLARRQRRKVDFLFDVKYWGLSKVWEMKVKTRKMSGDEFGKFYWGEISGYPLPKCHEKLKELDEQNKNRIRKELVEGMAEEERIIELKKRPRVKYKCPGCGHVWHPHKKNPKRCPDCQRRLRIKEGEVDAAILGKKIPEKEKID